MTAFDEMMKTGRGGGRKSGGLKKYKKPAGRPKIKQLDGCTVFDEWSKNRHVYTQGNKILETCKKCGKEHPDVKAWRKRIAEGEYESHPFVKAGVWSFREYQNAMKR